ncbi:DUF2064 domain-containing protein [Pedobacter sp. SD-b]|uniref:DUF2064 domain-containing protein n=1 Tax=Pedobacter segetis TaxID=2793069 RepID=A0ABS1BLQ9_9SPHI|nr:DUF2064 domain-containing protein [Pedobacter segetis]MBK0383837.1 DUF2064 domain-containing protein [Pedobacter segetis]
MKQNLQKSKTCVLYFTRGKSGVKSFSSSKKKSAAVQRLLFFKTLSEIRKTKLDFQISNGKIFGEDVLNRLNGAVAQIFASGFEQIIVVGDDTPELSIQQILQADQALKNGNICIGPAKDGGTYLMAFSRSDFQKGILQNLTWHNANFRDELLENIASAHLDYELLAPLEDLDTASDLSIFLSRSSINSFFRILKNLFFIIQKRFSTYHKYSQKFFEYSLDRGPPKMI